MDCFEFIKRFHSGRIREIVFKMKSVFRKEWSFFKWGGVVKKILQLKRIVENKETPCTLLF